MPEKGGHEHGTSPYHPPSSFNIILLQVIFIIFLLQALLMYKFQIQITTCQCGQQNASFILVLLL